jgi:hypothetical protein
MIPACDPSILKNNPQFQRLYEHLATLLNPDGSTCAHSADPTVAEVGRGASQNHPHHNKDQAEMAVADHSVPTGPKTMSNTERKEADQGADAQAAGVRSRQRAPERGAQRCPSSPKTRSNSCALVS